MGARGKDPVAAALPGLVVGCALYLGGGVLGSRLGPGWADILQGGSFFVGLILVVVGVRRWRSKQAGKHAP